MFGRGAVVAQLTVNQLVAGSNPAARAILFGVLQISILHPVYLSATAV